MKPILILGTGPTLNGFEVGLFRGEFYVIAVNDAYRVCPWADMFYACDWDWWVYHGPKLATLPGEKVTVRWDDNTPENKMAREVQAIRAMRRGWSVVGDQIYLGHNSGFQALQIAAQKKPPAIYLAGFDMGATGQDEHFFGRHPPQLAVGSEYRDFIKDFEEVIDEIRASVMVRLLTSPSGISHLFETALVEDVINELQTA